VFFPENLMLIGTMQGFYIGQYDQFPDRVEGEEVWE